MKIVDPNQRILALLNKRGSASSSEVARVLRVSRQAAHRRLAALAERQLVVHQGAGRTAHWQLPEASRLSLELPLAGLAEDEVWDRVVRELRALGELRPITRGIAFYAFTEMLNNAIDHSGSTSARIRIEHDSTHVAFEIEDDGIGALRKVQTARALSSPLDALQQLSKGKVTTSPERHTGEGLFFTSKAVERFELESTGLRWIVDNLVRDQAVLEVRSRPGTRVLCRISKASENALEGLFAEYTRDFQFTRTRTVVKLFAHGVEFVSRSQAKRLVEGLDAFRDVVIDFEHVTMVGQGFADEVFRVWAKGHTGTKLEAVHMVPTVELMVRRALAVDG